MLGFRYVNIVSIVICIWIDLIPIFFFILLISRQFFFRVNNKWTTTMEKQQPIYLTHGVCTLLTEAIVYTWAQLLNYIIRCGTCTHMFLIPMIFGKWNSVKNVFNECYLKIECESHHLFCIVMKWNCGGDMSGSLCFIDEMNFIHQKKDQKKNNCYRKMLWILLCKTVLIEMCNPFACMFCV